MGAATDAELLARAVHNPARLILGPTTTTGGIPYGGVSLGLVRDADIIWHGEYVPSKDPSSGRVQEVGVRGVEYPELYVLIEGNTWDEDVLQNAFTSAVGPSGLIYGNPPEALIQGDVIPHGRRAWAPVLFAALDPKHKSVYFRRPVLTIALGRAVAFAHERKSGLPLFFTPTPSSRGVGDWQCARLENISL